MNTQVVYYEEWMKDQVERMFLAEYGWQKERLSDLMADFYTHPYQLRKCIRIVALENRTVTGFQSLFYWPYVYEGKVFNSYQSGNSLVHPEHRGKGVFRTLLNFVEENRHQQGIDFMMGFPVDASRNSFIRDGWKNILNLHWQVRFINPVSILRSLNKQIVCHKLPFAPLTYQTRQPSALWRLSNDPEFTDWRNHYMKPTEYYGYSYAEGSKEMSFQMKIQVRKRVLKELVLGNIETNSGDPVFLRNGINSLCHKARSTGIISLVSFASNSQCKNGLSGHFAEAGFKTIDRRISFIVKPFSTPELLLDPTRWELYRSDIDTW